MSFISVAVAIGLEGTAATIAAGAMMGGSVTIGSNVLRGRNPFDNIGQGILMGGFTAGITPFVQSGIGEFVTGGISNAAATGITAGALGYARSGNINDALTAGLGAYGLANLGGNLESAGGESLANADTVINAQRIGEAAGEAAVNSGLPETAPNAIDTAGSEVPRTSVAELKAQMVRDGFTPEEISAKLSEAGRSAVGSDLKSAGSFLKANAKNLMYAAAPLLADQAVQSNMPQTATPRPGMIRPYSYDPYSGTYTAYDPYKAADGGLMGYGESTNAPITRRNIDAMQNTNGMFNYAQDGGGVMSMAHGGLAALAFADGGGVDMTSPYMNALAHPETIPLQYGETQEQGLARIQAQQDELNQRVQNRMSMNGGQSQTVNWTQSPAGLNPSSPTVQTQADVDYWTKRAADARGSPFTTGGDGTQDNGQRQVDYIESLMATNPAPVGPTNAQMQYDAQMEQARLKADREAVAQYHPSVSTGEEFQISGYMSPEETAKQKAIADALFEKYKPAPLTNFVIGGDNYDSNGNVTVGPYNPNAPAYVRPGGTTDQGYSRNYSGEELATISGTFDQYQNDPAKLMELMNKYGVNVNDLALARSGSNRPDTLRGYDNLFLQAGANKDWGGMSAVPATTNDKTYIDWMLTQPNPLGSGTLADVYKSQGIDPYTDPRVLEQAKEQNNRAQARMDIVSGKTDIVGPFATNQNYDTKTIYDRSGQPNGQIAPWLNPNWAEDEKSFRDSIAARDAAATAASPKVVVGGKNPRSSSTTGTTTPTNTPSAPNTPSAAQQYKDQHLVDPTTGHLLNPTLDADTLKQLRDGINTNAEMRQAYNGYWNTVKPGDILDFAGGTLTMNPDGSATHSYIDGSGKQQSYTFNKNTDFATVANSDPNIANEWKSMFNYTAPKNTDSPIITTPGPTGPVLTPGTGNPGRVTQVPTGWTPPVAPPSKVPTSFEDFNTKYNTLTGGSKQAYDYLTGKTDYSPTPYTKTGEIMKPYAESVLGIPEKEGNPTKKYLFQDGKYVKNPAFRPPKPVGPPVEGKEWAWDGTKWTQMAPDDLTNHDVEPRQPAGEGLIWYWQDNKWVKIPAPIKDPNKTNDKANGGLMALAGGGMAERYNLGGYSDGGRLLRGPGDGVSDSIPASIGNRQPARLADGEFVVPARIVSELGNGSTEAGARKLYAMMDRVQHARRHSIGKGNVAKNSRADKYLPA